MVRRLACLLLFFSAGCAPMQRFPSLQGEQLAQRVVDDIAAEHQASLARIQNIKILYRMKVSRDGKLQSQRLLVSYKKPARYLLEVYPITSFYLLQKTVLRDDRYLTVNAVDATGVRGPVSDTTMAELLGIPVSVDEILPLVLGVLPEKPFSAVRDAAGLVHVASQSQSYYAEVASDAGKVRKIDFFDSAALRQYSVSYEGSVDASGAAVPRVIHVEIPKFSAKIDLIASSVKVNSGISDAEFSFEVPASIALEEK